MADFQAKAVGILKGRIRRSRLRVTARRRERWFQWKDKLWVYGSRKSALRDTEGKDTESGSNYLEKLFEDEGLADQNNYLPVFWQK